MRTEPGLHACAMPPRLPGAQPGGLLSSLNLLALAKLDLITCQPLLVIKKVLMSRQPSR